MTLSKVVRKGSYQGVAQWGISTSTEITPSHAIAQKWAELENASNKPVSPKHYIAGSGEYGCLYDSCAVYRTYKDAVDGLAETFDLGRTRRAKLGANGHLDLNPGRDGASYCEITACTCAKPWEHDETQSESDWTE